MAGGDTETAGSGSGRGRLALSVDAGSVPGADGKGRRLSCTVALAVAGALAAVTLGGTFLAGLLPGSTDSASRKPPQAGEQTPGHQGSAKPDEEKPDKEKPGAAVPRSFLGTWEGKAEAMDGLLPAGTVRVVVQQAGPGEKFGTASMTDELGLSTCTDVLVLKKATADEIVATGQAKVKGDARCTSNDHEVRLTRVGDDLNYVSVNPDGGNPKARLSRR
ncbi:hypothetical protein [Streptomyces boluensis]|uniref:Serine/threonine protein kinase n=1 Tax=Streptomyces boluensis TaxID=1775135 RepID=A0A964XJX2_9ACTN|nr:hypothetical protein [Streptomyces boluensis]NBE51610.1 hypothetical protein [Streptomyces boluensis]